MTNGQDRLDRIEGILEELAVGQRKFQEQVAQSHQDITARHQEMAARQHYHDEAFERHDAEMKVIREAIAADAENIRGLARIAELHHERLERFEGEEPA